MRFFPIAMWTGVLMTLAAQSATAAPALATTAVNLRQGPGTTYPGRSGWGSIGTGRSIKSIPTQGRSFAPLSQTAGAPLLPSQFDTT